MKIAWQDPIIPPVNPDEITRLETTLGVLFPESYKEILSIGDELEPKDYYIYKINCSGKKEVVDALFNFLSIKNDKIFKSRQGMLDYTDSFDRDMRALKWVIPIAYNGDGYICLDYTDDPERKTSKVVAFAVTPVSNMDENGLYPIADSFEDMIEMLSR